MKGSGDQDDRHRWQGPGSKSARHPKMKPYDDGGLVDLVKAIAANLKEERAAKAEAKNKPKTPSNHDKHRSRRHDRPRSDRERSRRRSKPTVPTASGDPTDEPVQGPEHPSSPDVGTQSHSEDHDEPPVDAEQEQAEVGEAEGDILGESAQAEIRQQEEIDAAKAREATEGTGATDSLHSDEHTAGSASQAEGPVHDDNDSPTPTPTVRPINQGRQASVETDDEHSDYRDSGDESDHSATSTRATVPSSNTPLSTSSGRSNTSGRGGRRGRRSGLRGGGADFDEDEEEFYNLHEAYDDEYDRSGDESPLLIRGNGEHYITTDIGDEFYYTNEDSNAESAHDQTPKVWVGGRPNGMPRTFNPLTGRSGWYAEGTQAGEPLLVWLESATNYVTVAEFNRASRPSSSNSRAPQTSEPHSTRQQPSGGVRSSYRPRPTGGTYSSRNTYIRVEETRGTQSGFSSRPENPSTRTSYRAGEYRDSTRAQRSPPPTYSSRQNSARREHESPPRAKNDRKRYEDSSAGSHIEIESESESGSESTFGFGRDIPHRSPQPTDATNSTSSRNYENSKEKSKSGTETDTKNKKNGKQSRPSFQPSISDSDSDSDTSIDRKPRKRPSGPPSLSGSDSDSSYYSHSPSAHPPNPTSSANSSTRDTHTRSGTFKPQYPSSSDSSDTDYQPRTRDRPPPKPQSRPSARHEDREEKSKGGRSRQKQQKKETYTTPIPPPPTDYYAVIGVSRSASAAE